MSSTVTKFLYASVGVALTVGMIFIGIGIYRDAVDTAKVMQARQQQVLTEIEEAEILKYEGVSITGSTAVTYIKKIYDETEVHVYTRKADNTKTDFKVESSQFSDYKNSATRYYINPLDTFTVSVTRDANNVITRVDVTNTRY